MYRYRNGVKIIAILELIWYTLSVLFLAIITLYFSFASNDELIKRTWYTVIGATQTWIVLLVNGVFTLLGLWSASVLYYATDLDCLEEDPRLALFGAKFWMISNIIMRFANVLAWVYNGAVFRPFDAWFALWLIFIYVVARFAYDIHKSLKSPSADYEMK